MHLRPTSKLRYLLYQLFVLMICQRYCHNQLVEKDWRNLGDDSSKETITGMSSLSTINIVVSTIRVSASSFA